jgi:HEAT repeat protein
MGYFGNTFPTKDDVRRLIVKKDTKGLVRAIGLMAGQQSTGRSLEELVTRKVRELITEHDHWAVDPLIKAARDESCQRHYNIFMALAKVKDARVFDLLVGMLGNPDLRIRRSAIQALGELQDERAVEPLVSTCEDCVRERVAEALVRIGSGKALEALKRLAGEEEARPEAVQTLGNEREA